jgi:hypothetical protein
VGLAELAVARHVHAGIGLLTHHLGDGIGKLPAERLPVVGLARLLGASASLIARGFTSLPA